MFCPNCGKKVEDGVRFCANCGTLQNFVPQQNVPHNFRPYSIEEKKAQQTQRLNALADPFGSDELPEETPVKSIPTVDPFGNPLPISQEEDSSSHWGIRLTIIILLVGMLTLTLVQPGSHIDGIKIMEILYKLIDSVQHMRTEDLVAWVTSMLFFNGVILCTLVALIKLLSNRYRITVTLSIIALLSLCGFGACGLYKLGIGYPIAFFVVSVVCDILNRWLVKKKKADENDVEISDIPNPLL